MIEHPYITFCLLALSCIALGMWLDRTLRGYQVTRLKRKNDELTTMLHGEAPSNVTRAFWHREETD